jgi:hypothetical protein
MATDQNGLHSSIYPALSSVRALSQPIAICSQIIVKRQALPIIRIHRHLRKERRRSEQLDFDPVRGNHITGSRDTCAGQERRENDLRETAHGSARIRGFGAVARAWVEMSAVGGLGVRSAWTNETGRWRTLAHRSDARRVGRCERRLAGTASPLGRGWVRANFMGVGWGRSII